MLKNPGAFNFTGVPGACMTYSATSGGSRPPLPALMSPFLLKWVAPLLFLNLAQIALMSLCAVGFFLRRKLRCIGGLYQ